MLLFTVMVLVWGLLFTGLVLVRGLLFTGLVLFRDLLFTGFTVHVFRIALCLYCCAQEWWGYMYCCITCSRMLSVCDCHASAMWANVIVVVYLLHHVPWYVRLLLFVLWLLFFHNVSYCLSVNFSSNNGTNLFISLLMYLCFWPDYRSVLPLFKLLMFLCFCPVIFVPCSSLHPFMGWTSNSFHFVRVLICSNFYCILEKQQIFVPF
jgi:hypothetical protein